MHRLPTRSGSRTRAFTFASTVTVLLLVPLLLPGGRARAGDEPTKDEDSRTVAEWIECLMGDCPQTRAQAIEALAAAGAEAVPPLIGALTSGSRTLRTGAIEALGRMGPIARSAVPILFEALREKDDDVAVAAARALGELGRTIASVRTRLLKFLEDDGVYQLAAKALARTGTPAVPEALKILRDGERTVQLRVLYFVLAEMGPGAMGAVPRILTLLQQEDDELRQAAEEVLSAVGADPELITTVLLEATGDADAEVRLSALKYLGGYRVGTLEALQAYAQRLTDEDDRVRLAAAHALADVEADTAPVIDVLLDGVRDPQLEVVAAVCTALSRSTSRRDDAAQAVASRLGAGGALGTTIVDAAVACGEAAVPYLALRLGAAAARVVRDAARALGRIGPPAAAATPHLLDALQTADAEVQGAIQEAIRTLGAPAVAQLLEVLADRAPDRRRSAATALGALGPTAAPAVKALTKTLRDRDIGVRREAATALGRVGPDAVTATAALAKALRDKDAEVRVAAAAGLGGIGPGAGKSAKALAKALSDPEPEVQRASADALGLLGEAAAPAIPNLLSGLRTLKSETRWRIARALARIALPKKGVVGGLEKGLRDEDARVRKYAARGLGALGTAATGSAKKVKELLADPDPDVRAEAKAALERLQAD